MLVAVWTSAILVVITHVFNIRISGFGIQEESYYYLVLGLFLSTVFIYVPPGKRFSLDKVPWYDVLLFLLSFGSLFYFYMHGLQILQEGWEWFAPVEATILAAITCLLVLEAARRSGGLPLLIVVLVFFLFPLYTIYLPGILKGFGYDLSTAMNYFVMGKVGVIGIPVQVSAKIVMGYMLFGAALMACGAGQFFFDAASLILGRTRGGPAKVAVLASGFFASMSGSVVGNVITTGTSTIPTMKRIGYPPRLAAAIEAVASTGGAFTPPVMGAVAFIMASFLEISYITVVIAAIVPAIAYFTALLIQVDAFAARTGLPGLPAEELPSVRKTLGEGWHIIVAFLFLLYILFFYRYEVDAPYYATGVLFLLALIRKPREFKPIPMRFIMGTGQLMGTLFAICAGVGFILSALAMTGVGPVFPMALVRLAAGNLALLIAFGAFASIILGMGMTTVAVYIFLAITIAPALVAGGLNILATHLFVFIFGTLSAITPPVALAAFVAAGIARTSPMKVGFEAVRFGIAAFLVPFFFLLNPALILQGSVVDILHGVLTLFSGIFLLAAALGGYLLGVGKLGWVSRVLLVIAGFLVAMPGLSTDIVGASLAVVVIAICLFMAKKSRLQDSMGWNSPKGI